MLQGFCKIESLAPYTALRALWLNHNGISSDAGIEDAAHLRALYLGSNCVRALGQGPRGGVLALRYLTTLDLEQNALSSLDGVQHLPRLRTLNVSKNHLAGLDALLPLADCPSLTSLDVSSNELDLAWEEDLEEDGSDSDGEEEDGAPSGAGASESKSGGGGETAPAPLHERMAAGRGWAGRLARAAGRMMRSGDGASLVASGPASKRRQQLAAAVGLQGPLATLSLPWDLAVETGGDGDG